jgi:ankyrin repeat protein
MSARHEIPAGLKWQEIALEAVRADDFDALVSSLNNGVPVNHTDDDGNSLLKIACEIGALSIARVLLERGADTERRDIHDRTPLVEAASRGNIRMVRLLVGYGADVTADQGRGRLPVDYAAMSGYPEIVRYLESVSRSGKIGRLILCRLVRGIRWLTSGFRGRGFYFVAGH